MFNAILSTVIAIGCVALTTITEELSRTLYGCAAILWSFAAVKSWYDVYKRRR